MIFGSNGLGGIFDHRDVVTLSDVIDAGDIRDVSVRMDDNDRPRMLDNSFFGRVRIEAPRVPLNVYEDRLGSEP